MVSSVLAQAILSQKAPDLVGEFQRGQESSRAGRSKKLAGQALASGGQGLDELTHLNPELALTIGEQIRARNANDINDYIRDARVGEAKLRSGDVQGFLSFGQQRIRALELQGRDSSQTQNIVNMVASGKVDEAQQLLAATIGTIDQSKRPAALDVRDRLLADLDSEDENVSNSAKVSLGLRAREGIGADEIGARERAKLAAQLQFKPQVQQAVGDIQSSQAIATAGASQTARLEADKALKPQVESLVESAKGQSKIATKVVEESFGTIKKAQRNIGNIDRAISAIDKGAKTGVIEKFLPNIRASSIELNQLRNELGLDVIGGVTFGALSQGELDLALNTALPTGLNEADLRDFLVRKRDAQTKTIANLRESVQFLSQPGATVADFIASKSGSAQDQQTEPNPAQKNIVVDF